MKVLFSLCGDRSKASSRVRGYWIAEELEKLGHACRLKVTDSKARIVTFAFATLWSDAVVFQKTYSRYHLGLMRLAKFLGKKVYLDVDDLPSRTGEVSTLRNFSAMANVAHTVFAGSGELAKDIIAAGGRAYIVPTGVRVASYRASASVEKNSASDGTPCIGWIGNGAHYEKDLLEVLLPALHLLADTCRFRLKLVGVAGAAELHRAMSAVTAFEVELVDQLDWADSEHIAETLNSFDIGVYPLLANSFNTRKCGFKALEYMASGIPVVASDIGANGQIVRESETGFLVVDQLEWVSALSALISDKKLRDSMGKAGRLLAESEFDVSQIAQNVSGVLAEVTGNA